MAEYDKSGTVRDKRSGRTEIASYSREQIDKAVFFYHSYRRGVQAVAAALGYPSASTLRRWAAAAGQAGEIKSSKSGEELLQYTTAAAVAAAVEFSNREHSLDDSSGEHGLSKRQVKEAATVQFNKENETVLRKPDAENNSDSSIENLMREKAELEQERNALPEQIHRLQMERDALEAAVEL